MKREMISEAISLIDERYIEEALFAPANSCDVAFRRRDLKRAWTAAAACFLLIAALATAVACAAEVREYQTAVSFFEENGLSREGLDRSAVKAVYRDIITHSFSYEKTAEVLQRSIPGWDLKETAPTPEEMAEAWDKNAIAASVPQVGFSYKYDYCSIPGDETNEEIFEKTVVKCYRNGRFIWKREFYGISAGNGRHFTAGTALWGATFPGGKVSDLGWAAVIDDKGEIVWENTFSSNRRVAAILDNEDGTWAMIGLVYEGDSPSDALFLATLDAKGNEISLRKTVLWERRYGAWNAVRIKDGYLVQLIDTATRSTTQLCRIDREGDLVGRYVFESLDYAYYLTDMAVFSGQAYLSAYAVPKQRDGNSREIGGVLETLFPDGSRSGRPDREKLVRLLRDHYTAVLFICDVSDVWEADGVTPREFYSVKGALGGRLSADDPDRLYWDVENLTAAKVNPYTVLHEVKGTCKVIRYSFDPSGKLIQRKDTSEVVGYYR